MSPETSKMLPAVVKPPVLRAVAAEYACSWVMAGRVLLVEVECGCLERWQVIRLRHNQHWVLGDSIHTPCNWQQPCERFRYDQSEDCAKAFLNQLNKEIDDDASSAKRIILLPASSAASAIDDPPR